MAFSPARRLAGALAFSACAFVPGLADADDFSPDTRIGAVTVFPSGADIARQVKVSLPAGTHRLIFDHLPGGIDAEDVRVEGTGGFTIQSVDVARVPVVADPLRASALKREREALTDKKAMLEGRIRTAEVQRQMILTLVRPQANADGAAPAPAMAPEALFSFIAARHEEIEAQVRAAGSEIRDTDRRLAEIDRALSRGLGEAEWESRITVSVSADAQGEGGLTLRYRMAAASWRPVYDARLDTSARQGKLTLAQRAEVSQRTGEDWSGVELTLATARAHGATSAPEIETRYVGFLQPMPRLQQSEKRAYGDAAMAPAPEAAPLADAVAEEREAAVRDLGFDAVYAVPGRADIPTTGDARLVLVARHETDVRLEARIVPAALQAAFLTARFANQGEAPLPAGQVRLFRDGVFVGQGRMPMASPGQETALGFGRDERVGVKRTLVSSRQAGEGIFSRARTETSDWRTEIVNRHAFPVDIVVLESLPQPRDGDITVTALASNDPADESNVEDKPGVLAWRFGLPAQEARTLAFGYRIDWPEGRQVIVGMR